jgi:hypothetical protein
MNTYIFLIWFPIEWEILSNSISKLQINANKKCKLVISDEVITL